jgi:hypothetical protein
MTPADYVATRALMHSLSRALRRECERLGFCSDAVPAALWYAERFGSVQCGADVGHNHGTVRQALDELAAHGALEAVEHRDRRRRSYRLTEAGRDLAGRLAEVLA